MTGVLQNKMEPGVQTQRSPQGLLSPGGNRTDMLEGLGQSVRDRKERASEVRPQ